MRWISVGGLAVFSVCSLATSPAQQPAPTDGAVERAVIAADPTPPVAKPPSEFAADSLVLDQKFKNLEAAEARAKNSKDKSVEAHLTELKGVLQRHRVLLKEWNDAVKARQAAEHPEITPETEAATLKAAADNDRAALARAAKDPSSLLPEVFRSTAITEAAMAEMSVAIERAQGALDDANKAVDDLTVVHGRKVVTPLAAVRADRDEIRKRIDTIAPRIAEAETAVSTARTDEARDLAREKLANLDWERKIESEKLREAEAKIDLESRKAALGDLRLDDKKVKRDLAQRTRDTLTARYKERVDRQVATLKQASAHEGAIAAHSTDPINRYRAQRSKELLDQRALLEERDRELKTTPAISLRDQARKTTNAEERFVELKKLVASGRSTDIVAQRLNNNYRRLATERASLVKNELAQVTAKLNEYEEELTRVELDELNELRGDRAFRENFLSQIPANRQAEASTLFEKFEGEQHAILSDRKKVLTELSTRAEDTRKEIQHRIEIMDEAYAFIRTHLFWVRDQKPLGTVVDEGRREVKDAAKTVLGMAGEPWIRSHWGRVTPEFLLTSAGLLVIPWILHRTRRTLRQKLDRASLAT